MTDEQAAQLQALYNQVVYNKKLGDDIIVSVSGSHTNNSYSMQICYLNSTKICLLGNTNLGSANLNTSLNNTWTINIPAGRLTVNAITKTGVKIPTIENICTTTANFKRGFQYWTSTKVSTNTNYWGINSNGLITEISNAGTTANIPYVVIDL